MRRIVPPLMAGARLTLGAAACDGTNKDAARTGAIDEDDTKVGPGDGHDEVGPGR